MPVVERPVEVELTASEQFKTQLFGVATHENGLLQVQVLVLDNVATALLYLEQFNKQDLDELSQT